MVSDWSLSLIIGAELDSGGCSSRKGEDQVVVVEEMIVGTKYAGAQCHLFV